MWLPSGSVMMTVRGVSGSSDDAGLGGVGYLPGAQRRDGVVQRVDFDDDRG